MTPLIRELFDLVKASGKVVTLHGKPIDSPDDEAFVAAVTEHGQLAMADGLNNVLRFRGDTMSDEQHRPPRSELLGDLIALAKKYQNEDMVREALDEVYGEIRPNLRIRQTMCTVASQLDAPKGKRLLRIVMTKTLEYDEDDVANLGIMGIVTRDLTDGNRLVLRTWLIEALPLRNSL
mgnify:CR=1 FL=1